MRNLAISGAVIVSVVLLPVAAAWAVSPVNTTFFGVAIDGYDPVAYFTQGKPVKGDKAFSYRWQDAEWRFSSRENLERFKGDPETYAPRYGGYCAWAVSRNKTAGIDPQYWRIVDGKLYLNYSESVQNKWAEDIEGNIEKADANWPGLLDR